MLALTNGTVYTGRSVETGKAVVIEGERIAGVVPPEEVPSDAEVHDLGGRSVAPGFVDLQVNGGGGRLFAADPTVEAIETIVAAHLRFGTTSLLPTWMTGPPESMERAAEAVRAYLERGRPGVLGIHFEGPFINPEKAGVHDRRWIRPPSDAELARVASFRGAKTLVTLAPEVVPPDTIRGLCERGVRVSLGHSNARYAVAVSAFAAGASCVTHLFNAMSGMTSREAGLVGAALDDAKIYVGVIADGHHVGYPVIRVSARAKGAGRLLLVTDAMPPVGATMREFTLGDARIRVSGGRCVTEGGVLAGSAIDMATAVRNCVDHVDLPLAEALRMASTYPAEYLGLGGSLGRIEKGYAADLVVFEAGVRVGAVVRRGLYQTV